MGHRWLDSTLVLYGASIGDPNAHDHNNLPTLVAGGKLGGGRSTASAMPRDGWTT